MSNFILTKEKLNNIFIILGLSTFIFTFIGFYFESNLSIIETFYKIFDFFSGGGDLLYIKNSYFLKIAAITAPLSVAMFIGVFFYQEIIKWFFLTFRAKDHLVICGLGNMGYTFALNMLNKYKNKDLSKVVIIESDEQNVYIDELKLKGAIVLIGDAGSAETLKSIKIIRAKKVLLFTGNDITNIEIATSIASVIDQETRTNELSVYSHIVNRESYELLATATFENLDLKPFNLYDNAAQTLFLKYPLGLHVDTVKTENAVKLAIIGFDQVGKSILYRALNLGFFYNSVPIEITVFDNDIENKKEEFLKAYPIFDQNFDGYWKVNFQEEHLFYKEKTFLYTEVVFCKSNTEKSFSDAMKLMKNNTSYIIDNKINIYLFAEMHQKISNMIDKDNSSFKNLFTFGDFETLCSYDVIINEDLDLMAEHSHDRYNDLHGYPNPWDDLNTFLKESNRMQVEHLFIKLYTISRLLTQHTEKNNYENTKKEARKKWFNLGSEIMLWDEIKGAKEIIQILSLDDLDRLAQVEHKRWNAFHLLNGWKTLVIDKECIEKIEKDKERKLHPCLVGWDELDKVSKNHKHNYKSDDVETVIRAYEMIKDIKDSENSLMKDSITDFIKLIEIQN